MFSNSSLLASMQSPKTDSGSVPLSSAGARWGVIGFLLREVSQTKRSTHIFSGFSPKERPLWASAEERGSVIPLDIQEHYIRQFMCEQGTHRWTEHIFDRKRKRGAAEIFQKNLNPGWSFTWAFKDIQFLIVNFSLSLGSFYLAFASKLPFQMLFYRGFSVILVIQPNSLYLELIERCRKKTRAGYVAPPLRRTGAHRLFVLKSTDPI